MLMKNINNNQNDNNVLLKPGAELCNTHVLLYIKLLVTSCPFHCMGYEKCQGHTDIRNSSSRQSDVKAQTFTYYVTYPPPPARNICFGTNQHWVCSLNSIRIITIVQERHVRIRVNLGQSY